MRAKLSFDETKQAVKIEYDISRLTQDDIAALLRGAALDIQQPLRALSGKLRTGPSEEHTVIERRKCMSGIADGKCAMKIQMDRLLTSAVVLSWEDLLHAWQRELIHIEYAPGKSLEYLKIWQLTGKGEWSLVCEYWMPNGTTASIRDGMRFSNDYHSAGLAAMLEVIMQHQESFAASLIAPGAGLIQVTLPTDQESVAAMNCMRHAYQNLGLTFAQIPRTAVA